MQNVIIDTDVAIDYLRGIQYAEELIIPLWKGNTAYLSILSLYELQAGMRENERENTNNFINACNVELVTQDIAVKAGALYRHHRKSGITLDSIDGLIAATAMIKKYKVATRNVKHYPDERLHYKHQLLRK